MLIVDAQRAATIFDYAPLVESLREQHRRPRPAVDDIYMEQPGGTGFLVRPAWRAGDRLGVKLASVFPENPAAGLPTVHAVYVLFEGRQGRPEAMIDGTWLTWFKTACDSALASSYLARDDARHLLMVGAGAMAPHLIKAHLTVRPSLELVSIWNRTRARADTLAADLDVAAEVRVVDELEAAVRNADVVSTATMSEEPLIRGEWLTEGTHLDLIGAYTPTMREADDAALRRGSIHVDLRETTVDAIGELMIPIANGVITADDVRGDLFELCSDEVPGRTATDEITIFKNGGGGHLDLMTAVYVMQRVTSG